MTARWSARVIDRSYPELIQALLSPGAWPHEVHGLQLIETHISWVILTGIYAYKVKKPVDLGFLDFSTLELRHFYCEEELRVNRRTAPELYLSVVPIGDTADGPRVGVEPAVEYAVRMRQFPREARLDRCLQAGLLDRAATRRLASVIASFHRGLPPRRGSDPALEAERAVKPARNNFVHLDPAAFGDETQQRLAVIEAWTLDQARALRERFGDRALQGFVRECHGDLHLENVLLLDGRFIPFDAIEFDPELRWIDTANDIAFLAMDLMARESDDLAFTLLSAWLEDSGDYASLAVLRFYLVYRAMVRAVVTAIRQQQTGGPQADSMRRDAAHYVELAAGLVDTPPARLYLMHGFSGSGKTWQSERLVAHLPALRVRSDLERKRLPGISAESRGKHEIAAGLYSPGITQQTYETLARYCETGLRAGFNMIADATFLQREQREMFYALARRLGVETVIVDCAAPPDVLRQRLRQRAQQRSDVSDADTQVLEYQLAHHDPIGREEAVEIDGGTPQARFLVVRFDGGHGADADSRQQ